MPSLKLSQIPDPVKDDFEVVDVSKWFGTDKKGNPYTINVYPMSVLNKGLLGQYMNHVGKVRGKDGEETIVSVPTLQHDSSAVIAAMCCRDDDNNLTFGVDYADAIKRIEELPSEPYREMITILAHKAIKLTGEINSKQGVDSAEKNSKATP